jgi:hypothetical protein
MRVPFSHISPERLPQLKLSIPPVVLLIHVVNAQIAHSTNYSARSDIFPYVRNLFRRNGYLVINPFSSFSSTGILDLRHNSLFKFNMAWKYVVDVHPLYETLGMLLDEEYLDLMRYLRYLPLPNSNITPLDENGILPYSETNLMPVRDPVYQEFQAISLDYFENYSTNHKCPFCNGPNKKKAVLHKRDCSLFESVRCVFEQYPELILQLTARWPTTLHSLIAHVKMYYYLTRLPYPHLELEKLVFLCQPNLRPTT